MRFDAAVIARTQFDFARAEHSSFRGADLTFADFSYAILVGANMTDAITERTNLHGVADTGVSWTKHQQARAAHRPGPLRGRDLAAAAVAVSPPDRARGLRVVRVRVVRGRSARPRTACRHRDTGSTAECSRSW